MAFYTIYPRDIQNICFQKRVRVVDIREPQEYRKYHYPGAVNIPYSDEDSWCCRFSINVLDLRINVRAEILHTLVLQTILRNRDELTLVVGSTRRFGVPLHLSWPEDVSFATTLQG